MPLELKDLATQKMMTVPEDGLTFGREGGDANIQIRDTGVSKRHARVFGENGAWFLEDLGSSNGTWLQKERIKDATELLPGDIFQMSQAKYEVVQVMADGEEGVEPTAMARDEDDGAASDEEPLADESEPTPKPLPAAAKEAPSKANKAQPPPKENSIPKGKPQPAPSKKGAAMKPGDASKKTEAGVPDSGGGGEPKKISVGYFLIAVPKAFAFYLGAIPVMLFNPVGTIRKAVKEQKHEAKGRWELVAWALPAQLIGAAFGFLGGLIYGLVSHTLSVGDILPIGRLIGAVIGAIVTGIVWHPFLNWWVNFLKGTSDDRSRTNFFLLVQTATALLALPAFVAQVLGLVPLPLIGLVPLVLSLGSSLIMLFITFSWFSEAGVVKWFRIVVMVVGGLACLSTLAGLPGAIAGRGTGVSSGSSVDSQVAAAEAQAEELRKQAEAQLAAAEKQGEAAVAAGEKQVEKVAAAAPTPPPAEDKKAAPPPPTPAPTPAPAPPPTPAPTPVAAAKGAEKPPEAAPHAAATGTGYAAWHSKWEAIEKRITDDPTVLNKDSGVLSLYKKLEEDIYEVEQKFAKGKKPAEKRVNDHLRDAELYEKTEKTVLELHGKLFK